MTYLKIRRWVRGKWFDFKERKYRGQEGWCMCGDSEESHGQWSGHGYVDSWWYNRDEFVRRGEK